MGLDKEDTYYYPSRGLNYILYLDFLEGHKPPLEYREAFLNADEIYFTNNREYDYNPVTWKKPTTKYLVYKLQKLINSHSAIYEFYRIEE